MIENLVLSCGTIKGFCYIGCLKVLYEKNIIKNLKNILGCSAGCIFAICIALNYTYDELKKIFFSIDLNILNDINYDNITHFFEFYGLQSGIRIVKIMSVLIKNKTKNKNMTLKQFYDFTNINIIFTTCCLNKTSIEYINYKNYPNLKIIDALIMSISLPILFKPFKLNNNFYVDGALLNGYPIDYFDKDIEKTLGILLREEIGDNKLESFEKYCNSLLFLNLNYNIKNKYEKYKKQTILIKTKINSFNFNLQNEHKEELICCGKNCSLEFFKNYSDS